MVPLGPRYDDPDYFKSWGGDCLKQNEQSYYVLAWTNIRMLPEFVKGKWIRRMSAPVICVIGGLVVPGSSSVYFWDKVIRNCETCRIEEFYNKQTLSK